MISFAGIILMVLGVASGLILLLAPFDIGPAIPGITTWILFPGFTLVGYVLFVVAEFRCEGEEGAAEIGMVEWVSWWASHRSSTLCRRRASSSR